jgi:hypothetical protein
VLVSGVIRRSGGVGVDLDCVPFYLSRVLYVKSVIFFVVFIFSAVIFVTVSPPFSASF